MTSGAALREGGGAVAGETTLVMGREAGPESAGLTKRVRKALRRIYSPGRSSLRSAFFFRANSLSVVKRVRK